LDSRYTRCAFGVFGIVFSEDRFGYRFGLAFARRRGPACLCDIGISHSFCYCCGLSKCCVFPLFLSVYILFRPYLPVHFPRRSTPGDMDPWASKNLSIHLFSRDRWTHSSYRVHAFSASVGAIRAERMLHLPSERRNSFAMLNAARGGLLSSRCKHMEPSPIQTIIIYLAFPTIRWSSYAEGAYPTNTWVLIPVDPLSKRPHSSLVRRIMLPRGQPPGRGQNKPTPPSQESTPSY